MANSSGWGGKRPGAGRKRKSLIEKQATGQSAKVLKKPLKASALPSVPDYFASEQAAGVELRAAKIYAETIAYLAAHDCVELVGRQLVESYSLQMARYIQCEEIISKTGFVVSRGSGGQMVSPYVTAAQDYLRTGNNIWLNIQQIVKDNSSVDWKTETPAEKAMKELLGVS